MLAPGHVWQFAGFNYIVAEVYFDPRVSEDVVVFKGSHPLLASALKTGWTYMGPVKTVWDWVRSPAL